MKPDTKGEGIELTFDLPHALAKVWRALTTPELLARWLAPNDMRPELGARFTVRPEDGPPVDCEVIEIEAQRRLALAWRISEADATVVRFELTPRGAGTVLRISHTGVGAIAAAPVQPPRLRARTRPGAPQPRRIASHRTLMKRAA